jgi:hypothetical protein
MAPHGEGNLAMSSSRERIVQLRDSIELDGYVIIPDVLGAGEVSRLIEATHVGLMSEAQGVLHREGEVFGVRDLVGRVPKVPEYRLVNIVIVKLACKGYARFGVGLYEGGP